MYEGYGNHLYETGCEQVCPIFQAYLISMILNVNFFSIMTGEKINNSNSIWFVVIASFKVPWKKNKNLHFINFIYIIISFRYSNYISQMVQKDG